MKAAELITLAAAALTPIVAVVGLIYGYANLRLARRRRQDELFDRRYQFYQRLRSIWLSTGSGAPNDEDPSVYMEDLIPIAEEAGFIFDKAIAEHVLTLAGEGHTGHPDFPDEAFIAPFRPFLSLERRSLLRRIRDWLARRLR